MLGETIDRLLLRIVHSTHWWQIGFVALVVVLIDPFGVNEATDRYSQDVVLRLASPFYGTTSTASNSDAPVTVVVIDDETIERSIDRRYPLRYTDTYDIVHAVMCGRPKAIFIDLLFRWQHDRTAGDFESLAQLLAPDDQDWPSEMCGDKPPVFVADLLDQPSFRVGTTLADRSGVIHAALRHEGVQRLAVNWRLPPGSYPLWLESTETAGDWRPSQRDGRVASPALHLYALHRDNDLGPFGAIGTTRPMTVAWSLFPAPVPDGAPISYPEHQDLPRMSQPPSVQFIAAAKLFLRGVSSELGRLFDYTQVDALSRTFPAYHISAADLLGRPFDTADENSGLRKAIEGRVVLIGAAFGHSGDDHHSPVHGQVPGVFLHAMALDNLFRFGDDAWISPPALISTACLEIGWDTVAVLGLLGGLALLHSRAVTLCWPLWLELLCAFAITTAAAVFLAFWLTWPPFNWLGVLFLFLVVTGWWRLSRRLSEDNRSF